MIRSERARVDCRRLITRLWTVVVVGGKIEVRFVGFHLEMVRSALLFYIYSSYICVISFHVRISSASPAFTNLYTSSPIYILKFTFPHVTCLECHVTRTRLDYRFVFLSEPELVY